MCDAVPKSQDPLLTSLIHQNDVDETRKQLELPPGLRSEMIQYEMYATSSGNQQLELQGNGGSTVLYYLCGCGTNMLGKR